jgi:TPP-dependent pyruvate/acetoin dehydrogenase alpha subunit
VPIASGVGLACKMRNVDSVTICFHGDGATCTGAFHEGLGLAAVWSLPVVFVCENNQYGMSTPQRDYTKLEHLADRAKAHGIPGTSVDGNDAVAVAKVARDAIDTAREGGGPTLIDAITYRFHGHHMGDPGTSYRTKEEIEEHRKYDPIAKLQDRLLEAKSITEGEIEDIQASIAKELDEAVLFATESPEPKTEDALEGVYYTAG